MAASMKAVLVLVFLQHSSMVDEEGTPRCRWNVFFRSMSLVANNFCCRFGCWTLNTGHLHMGSFSILCSSKASFFFLNVMSAVEKCDIYNVQFINVFKINNTTRNLLHWQWSKKLPINWMLIGIVEKTVTANVSYSLQKLVFSLVWNIHFPAACTAN